MQRLLVATHLIREASTILNGVAFAAGVFQDLAMTTSTVLAESTVDDRVRLVVRMAVRAFGDGSTAGEWLAEPNAEFDGESPLLVAKASVAGCARVCHALDELTSP